MTADKNHVANLFPVPGMSGAYLWRCWCGWMGDCDGALKHEGEVSA